MLQLSQSFLNRPVMSLRTGRPVATTLNAIINPNNLKIEGFFCQDSVEKKKQLILLYQDIRDVLPQGLVIDDHSVLTEPGELIRLQEILKLRFELLNKPVFSESKQRLGKVNDYAVDVSSMFVQKLYVSQPLLKNLGGGSLSVDRTRIVEITGSRIVVMDPIGTETVGSTAPAAAA